MPAEAQAAEAEHVQREHELLTILDALAQTRHAINSLHERLDNIESRLGN